MIIIPLSNLAMVRNSELLSLQLESEKIICVEKLRRIGVRQLKKGTNIDTILKFFSRKKLIVQNNNEAKTQKHPINIPRHYRSIKKVVVSDLMNF